MLNLRDYFQKGFKFVIIGAVGALVNWGVLFFLVQEFRVFYLTAEIIATVIAFGVNFNGNILVKNIHIEKDPSKVLPPSQDVIKADENITRESTGDLGD